MTITFRQPAAGWADPALDGLAGQIATEVIGTVKQAAATAPRSLQAAIGPSEVGIPCARRLAYRLLDWPEVNADTDPWASIIGTAVHAWMAETYEAENRRLGRERYLIERTLQITPSLVGHSDLFDRDLGCVMDWKVVGLDRLKEYRRKGPGEQYRTQAHIYGLGQQLAGERVEHVAVVFLPRGGRIDGLHVWTEPYDSAVAVEAIRRLATIRDLVHTIDPEANPNTWALLPTADAYCAFCPYYLPGCTDLSAGCPGHTIR